MEDKLQVRKIETVAITGNSLRALRTTKGYSQGKLAEILSKMTGQVIEQKQISRWEKSFEFAVSREMVGAIFNIFYGTKYEPGNS